MSGAQSLDLRRLFELRAAVGRFGEMDAAGWWNTHGVLGARGASVYKRGLPRTHFLARVRVVSAVARERSTVVFPGPEVATLWTLPPALERALSFEERTWVMKGDNGSPWGQLEDALAAPPSSSDLPSWLHDLALVDRGACSAADQLELAVGERGVIVPGPVDDSAVQLLAVAHARGALRNLVVPFIQGGLEDGIG